MTDDSIKRSDAIEAARDPSYIAYEIRKKIKLIPSVESAESMPEYIDNILIVRHYCNGMVAMNEECYNRLQKRDEPITTEEAIEHLQECGWLQEHDRILTEPKSGKWIDKGRNLWGCSNCGMEIYSESERDRNEFHKWCSRCGARMVKEANK